MAIITAMPTSFKLELLSGAHCFGAPAATTGNTHSGTAVIDGIASLTGAAVGMTMTDSNADIPAGSVITKILGAASVQLSANAAASHTGGTLNLFGDMFRIALIKHLPTASFGAATVNYADLGADEATGTGYTAGGLVLTNVSPGSSGTTAWVAFSGTVSWTSATLDVDGCLVYNATPTPRLGGASGSSTTGGGRAIYVGDFGGRQQVANGTLTVVLPAATATTALLRIA